MPKIIYDKDGNPIILPAGTEVVKELSNEDRTLYVCPDGDLVEIDKREGKIRNLSKRIDLGDYKDR